MRRKVLARAVHHKRSIACLGRSTPSDNFATREISGRRGFRQTDRSRRTAGDISLFDSAARLSVVRRANRLLAYLRRADHLRLS